MASSLELWIREYNEASKHAYDITMMISERSSFWTGLEAQRHPLLVRFNWKLAMKLLEVNCVRLMWIHEDDLQTNIDRHMHIQTEVDEEHIHAVSRQQTTEDSGRQIRTKVDEEYIQADS
ncbi:hypothetical protein Tco_0151927 [Tanacetum coccineum]